MSSRLAVSSAVPAPQILYFPGLSDYRQTWQAMQDFTAQRDAETPDQFWIIEHPPVYTQGRASKPEHLLNTGNIPVVAIDRGGQVTYHGPGQLVVYVLMDMRRRGWHVKAFVHALEQALIDFLRAQQIPGERRDGAPGVYVEERKIAALGLRVTRGCSYHGLSLNVDMDLSPFNGINPCGYPGLAVAQLKDEGVALDLPQTAAQFMPYLLSAFAYSEVLTPADWHTMPVFEPELK